MFNVVFYAVIRNWVAVVGVPQEVAGQEGLGTSLKALSALFYTNDRLVASPESARLQGSFDALTGLFNQVDLQTNKVKMVSMAFRPCHTPHAWSMEAHTCQVTGQGLSYR